MYTALWSLALLALPAVMADQVLAKHNHAKFLKVKRGSGTLHLFGDETVASWNGGSVAVLPVVQQAAVVRTTSSSSMNLLDSINAGLGAPVGGKSTATPKVSKRGLFAPTSSSKPINAPVSESLQAKTASVSSVAVQVAPVSSTTSSIKAVLSTTSSPSSLSPKVAAIVQSTTAAALPTSSSSSIPAPTGLTTASGWGAVFSSKYTTMQVINHSAKSATLRSVYRQMWPTFSKQIKGGDVVVLEFGHSDTAQMPGSIADRNTGCGSVMSGGGLGSIVVTGCDGTSETVYTIQSYVDMLCKDVKAAGATCIISSSTPVNKWRNGAVAYSSDGLFSSAASAIGVPYISHQAAAAKQMDAMGSTSAANFYLAGDNLQTNSYGADQFAQAFAAAALCNSVSAITSSLTPAGQALKGKFC